MIKFTENIDRTSQILAIGIGDAGASVIDKINKYNMDGIYTVLIDADNDNIKCSTAKEKFCIPVRLIKEMGNEASSVLATKELAKELKPFMDSLPKAEMVFTISGLGGSTGTVITPCLVQILREKSHWVWCLTTIPFFFEGKPKIINSLKRIKLLQQSANAVFVIPHDKIFKMVDKTLSIKEAFTPANNLCAELVLDVSRLTHQGKGNGWINLKFSDIKERMTDKKSTLGSAALTTSFGIGEGTGESRIQTAIDQAVSSPLLGKEVLSSAESLIVSIQGSEAITLDEVNSGIEYLQKIISKDIDIIFGVAINPILKGKVKLGLIATGLDTNSNIDNWDLSLSSTFISRDTGSIKKTPILNRPLQQVQKPKQTMIDFKKLQKGQFEKSEATVYGGEDLDVPTFLRKKK